MEEDAFNAIREGNLEKLNSLIKSGCNVNTQDEYGRTMLLVAASLGQAEIVRLLVDVGADVNQVNHDAQTVDEYTALAAAASKNQKHIIDYLAPKTNFELKKDSFKNALFSAIYEDNFETIQILVENYKVDVNIFRSGIWSKRGWSILMDAIEAEQLHTAKLLLKYGADPNYVEGDEGQTPIMCAVASHNLEFVSCLLEARANVNTPNTNGKTPLMKAAELGNTEVVKLLIKNGANADATDYANMDAIWYAEKMGNSEIKCIIRGDV